MRAPRTLRTRPHTTPPAPANTALRQGRVRRAAAELTPHAVEQIAQRVAQLLHEHQRHRRAARARAATRHDTARQTPRRHPHVGLRTRPAARRHTPRHRRQGPPTIRPRHRDRRDQEPARANAGRHCSGRGDAAPPPTPRPQPAVPLLPIHEPRARGIAPPRPHRKGAIEWHAKQQDRSLHAAASAASPTPPGCARTAKGTTSPSATRGRGTPVAARRRSCRTSSQTSAAAPGSRRSRSPRPPGGGPTFHEFASQWLDGLRHELAPGRSRTTSSR